ncbi:MAG: hypothetical protein LBM41_05675 [Ruminococcus sp.]|jgi:septal ring factor EnvC (AmiA/AmiB activator)|nr:hypothetical protein [Ruminococcus sp.]
MENLLELLQKRLIEFECYRDITHRLVYEPVDNFPDLLSQRDELLSEITETAKRIQAAGEGSSPETAEIKDIKLKIEAVKEAISKDDKKVTKRIKDEMSDTLEQIKSSEKTGRVASYIKKTTFNTTLGRSLNTIS